MPLDPRTTLAELAVRHAGASRVFHRHGLDFCCHGRVPLDEACRTRGLDPDRLIEELDEALADGPARAVGEAPLPELVEHILEHFHAAHREELARLLAMARKVEGVHADKPECPRGLADHIERIAESMELHMQKEEQILFPHILAGQGSMLATPIAVMEAEHLDHAANLRRLRELAGDFVPPEPACNTWRALLLGLEQLERDVMEHVHLENNALFPRALGE